MAAPRVEFDLTSVKDFSVRLRQAADGDFKKALELFVSCLAADFLQCIEDSIIERKVIDTRLLLASFHELNVSDGDLTVEVGTEVEYAAWVNDGHWANPQGVEVRFVPGRWQGDHFIYESGAKTGMILKQQWIEGAHYFDAAIQVFEKMFPEILEARLQDWLDGYFGGSA